MFVDCVALISSSRIQRLPGVEAEDFATALGSAAQV